MSQISKERIPLTNLNSHWETEFTFSFRVLQPIFTLVSVRDRSQLLIYSIRIEIFLLFELQTKSKHFIQCYFEKKW